MHTSAPHSCSELLQRLLDDQSQRWQRGDRVRVESYVELHPDLASDPEALLNLVHAEVLCRRQKGEAPALDEYLARFPQCADRIRRRWNAHDFLALHAPLDEPNSTGPELRTRPIAPPRRPIALPSLPGYEVQEVLGHGGMGVVFKAVQLAFGRTVAVKMIRSQVLAGAEELARFRTEAQAVGRLDHPHVVRVFAFGQEQSCPFLVMEYLAGGSLARLLAQGLPDVRHAAELVRQAALGVQAAHEAGILHRDLKPANILLDAAGQARVADFGLAKLLDADSRQTASVAVMGTPAYMAPEQAAGRVQDVGPATDVWSLGVLLYESLTGSLPFQGSTQQETLRRVRLAEPVSPRRLRPEVPPELAAVCLKCLRKEREQRYESAGALAEDLRAWLAGQPTRAWAETALVRRLGRNVAAVLGLLALLGSLLLGALVVRNRSSASDPSRPDTPQLLIGEKGLPGWFHFRLNGKEGRLIEGRRDGYSSLRGTEITFVDLALGVKWDDYRIRLQVRHVSSDPTGEVGMYFAGSEHPSAAGTVHRCIQISFNDLIDANDNIPPPLRGKVPRFEANVLRVGLFHALLAGGKAKVATGGYFLQPQVVKPVGRFNQPRWRTVEVEVSGPRVRVFWEGKLAGEFDREGILTRLRERLDWMKQHYHDQPAIQALAPTIDLRGTVGLYIYRGSASFRQARVEPLVGADGTARK